MGVFFLARDGRFVTEYICPLRVLQWAGTNGADNFRSNDAAMDVVGGVLAAGVAAGVSAREDGLFW
jgi:hypothetical protein